MQYEVDYAKPAVFDGTFSEAAFASIVHVPEALRAIHIEPHLQVYESSRNRTSFTTALQEADACEGRRYTDAAFQTADLARDLCANNVPIPERRRLILEQLLGADFVDELPIESDNTSSSRIAKFGTRLLTNLF